jgi:hypothetical protein
MADSASVRRNPEVDYETRDLPLRVVAFVAIGIFVLLGIAPLIILAAFPTSRGDLDRRLTIQPPAPHLQTDPPADLANYLRKERQLLGSYGWVDRAHGIAHVPIDIEMARLAREGIPGFGAPQRAEGRQ